MNRRDKDSEQVVPMSVYAYKFRTINGEGANPGRFELHLIRNGEVVDVVPYSIDDDVEAARAGHSN